MFRLLLAAGPNAPAGPGSELQPGVVLSSMAKACSTKFCAAHSKYWRVLIWMCLQTDLEGLLLQLKLNPERIKPVLVDMGVENREVDNNIRIPSGLIELKEYSYSDSNMLGSKFHIRKGHSKRCDNSYSQPNQITDSILKGCSYSKFSKFSALISMSYFLSLSHDLGTKFTGDDGHHCGQRRGKCSFKN